MAKKRAPKINPKAKKSMDGQDVILHAAFLETPATAKELLHIRAHECRWPVANGLFCGDMCDETHVYCRHHKEISIGHPRKPRAA